MMKDPMHCAHSSIHRILDRYLCVDCGAEFIPKNPLQRTKWADEQ